MRLLLFLKPWLLILFLLWEIDISGTSDPNEGRSSLPSNPTPKNQPKNSLQRQEDNSKFVVLTRDEKSSSKFVEVNKTDYLLEVDNNNNYLYRFKDYCKCSMLKYGNQIVWKHDFNKYGYYYPREITLMSDEINVEMGSCKLSYTFSINKWNLTRKTDFKTINYTDFTIFTLDDLKNTRLNINNTSNYDLLSYNSGLILYIFKDNAKCSMLKYKGETVWKHDFNKYGYYYPRFIVFKPDCHLYIDIYHYYYVYEFDYTSKSWNLNNDLSYKGSGLLPHLKHPNYLKIFTADNVSATNLKENDSSKYKVYNYFKDFYLYVFNSDSVCREFRYKDQPVWRYDHNQHPNMYPRSISVDMSTSQAHFDFTDKVVNVELSGIQTSNINISDNNANQLFDKIKIVVLGTDRDGSTPAKPANGSDQPTSDGTDQSLTEGDSSTDPTLASSANGMSSNPTENGTSSKPAESGLTGGDGTTPTSTDQGPSGTDRNNQSESGGSTNPDGSNGTDGSGSKPAESGTDGDGTTNPDGSTDQTPVFTGNDQSGSDGTTPTNLDGSVSDGTVTTTVVAQETPSGTDDDYLLLKSSNMLALFVFSDKVKTVEVKYNDNSVMKFERSENDDKFPKSLVFKSDGRLYIDIYPYYYVYKFDSNTNNFVLNTNNINKSYTGFGLIPPSNHPKLLKIFTADNVSATGLKKNDFTKYEVFNYFKDFYLYVFKPGVVCHEFRYKSTTFWKYSGIKYPRSISVDISESVFDFDFDFHTESMLHIHKLDTTSISFAGVTGEPTDDATTEVELNINKKESTDFFIYFMDEEDDLRIYTAKPGYIFSKIVDDNMIWEANNNKEYVWKVILKGTEGYPKYLLMLPLVGEYILYYKENEISYWDDITFERISFKDFNIFGYDKFGFGVKKFDFIHYKISTFKFMFGYKFREGVRCSNIKHNDVSLWSHSDLPKHSYPMALYYDMINKNLYLLFEYSDKHLFVPLTAPKCELVRIAVTSKTTASPERVAPVTETITTLSTSEIVVEHQPTIPTPVTTTAVPEEPTPVPSEEFVKTEEPTVLPSEEKKEEEPTPVVPEVPTPTVVPEGEPSVPLTPTVSEEQVAPSEEPTAPVPFEPKSTFITEEFELLIILDISKKDSCDQYYYSRDVSTKTETFIAKLGYKFKQVNNGGVMKWKAKNNNYRTKVILESTDDRGKVRITLCDAESGERDTPLTLKTREDSSLSTSSLQSDFKIITLDTSDNFTTKENDTTQYDFEDGNIMLTYKFNSDAKCVELKHGRNVIWKYNENKHKTHPKSLYIFKSVFLLVLGFSDNEFLLYGLTSENELECQSFNGVKDLSESDVKIITKDPSDNTKTKENDKTQYDFNDLDFAFEYKFKTNAECTEVKYKGDSLWKYSPVRHDSYPDSIYFMSESVLVFPRSEDTEESKTLEPVKLDIKSKKTTQHYDFIKKDKVQTYKAKKGYAFNKITQKKDIWSFLDFWSNYGDDTVIWQTNDPTKYAKKVIINYDKQRLIILLVDGTSESFVGMEL